MGSKLTGLMSFRTPTIIHSSSWSICSMISAADDGATSRHEVIEVSSLEFTEFPEVSNYWIPTEECSTDRLAHRRGVYCLF